MTATHAPTQHPAVPPFADRNVEDLILTANVIVQNCGISMGPQSLTRMARRFRKQVRRNGWTFFEYVANTLCLSAQKRAEALADPEVRKVLDYADPTGEQAVANVMASLR